MESKPATSEKQVRRTLLFHGNVQGVGFRYTTHNIASHYNVRGYVRNTRDGSVELIAEGLPRDIDSLMMAISDRMKQFIERIDHAETRATGEFSGFTIRH